MIGNYFVDANRAGNVITRRSHSGIFLFVQNAPTTRSHNLTVEAATFGSDFVELWICKELIVALRYKLRASIPESTLTIKHNTIHYISARSSAAARILSKTR